MAVVCPTAKTPVLRVPHVISMQKTDCFNRRNVVHIPLPRNTWDIDMMSAILINLYMKWLITQCKIQLFFTSFVCIYTGTYSYAFGWAIWNTQIVFAPIAGQTWQVIPLARFVTMKTRRLLLLRSTNTTVTAATVAPTLLILSTTGINARRVASSIKTRARLILASFTPRQNSTLLEIIVWSCFLFIKIKNKKNCPTPGPIFWPSHPGFGLY